MWGCLKKRPHICPLRRRTLTMTHKHSHQHLHDSGHSSQGSETILEEGEHSITKALVGAFWLNLLFSIVELIGGILTNSTAIIADAFHDFMDSVSIGLAILLERFSKKKRTERYSYGYRRFSMLSALGLSIFLLVGSIGMLYTGIQALTKPGEINSLGMLALAIVGFVVNGIAVLRVKKSGEEHHHTHGVGHTHNSRSVMLHLLEDVLGWAAVLVGAFIMYLTGWYWIDGVLTLGIAVFIGYNAWRNLSSTVEVMLQSIPKNVDMVKLNQDLIGVKGIQNIHDLHVWSLDGNYNVGSVHVVVAPPYTALEGDRRNQIIRLMRKHNIHHPTVQMEVEGQTCGFEQC